MLLFCFLACQGRIEPMDCIAPYRKTLIIIIIIIIFRQNRLALLERIGDEQKIETEPYNVLCTMPTCFKLQSSEQIIIQISIVYVERLSYTF